jgi:phage host-nuclease inhibitor protein Gam
MPRQETLFAPTELELKKHVGAIALVPTSRAITSFQRKAYNVIIYLTQEQGLQESYRAPLQQILVLSKADSRDYERVKKMLRALVSTVVEWQSPSDGEVERWDACGMLAHVALIKHTNGTLELEWAFAKYVRDALLSPERFARISLEYNGELKRHSAIVLMEICSRYIDNPGRLTARQEWVWWRPVLTGKPDFLKKTKKAPEYRYFKRDVLEPAIEEINRLTHLEVGLVEHKASDNKTVLEIQFSVKRKRPEADSDVRPAPANLQLLEQAIAAGLKEHQADELHGEYGEAGLVWGLEQVKNRLAMPSSKVGEVGNVFAWLRTRLSSRAVQEHLKGAKESNVQPAIDAIATKTLKAKWLDEWLRRRREALRKEFESLPEEVQAPYIAEHREALAKSAATKPMRIRFDTSGWSHRMVIADFLKRYALATHGEGWDKPTAEQLLEIAAQLGTASKTPT